MAGNVLAKPSGSKIIPFDLYMCDEPRMRRSHSVPNQPVMLKGSAGLPSDKHNPQYTSSSVPATTKDPRGLAKYTKSAANR